MVLTASFMFWPGQRDRVSMSQQVRPWRFDSDILLCFWNLAKADLLGVYIYIRSDGLTDSWEVTV